MLSVKVCNYQKAEFKYTYLRGTDMNKNIKATLIIIIGILALTTVVSTIYGIQNKIEVKNIYASYDENLLNAVNSVVSVCQVAFNEAKVSDEDMANLNDYISNIENAESPVLKAYIADSMVSYVADFMTVRAQKYSLGMEGVSKANFTGIQERLTAARTTLDSARAYSNEVTTEQTQN